MSMVLTLTRGELKTAVTGLGKVVNKRPTLPILNSICFEMGDKVTARATDMEHSARYTFAGAKCSEPGMMVIGIARFKDLMKGKPGDQIVIEQIDKEGGVISNFVDGREVKLSVAFLDAEDYPVANNWNVEVKPAKGFLEAYRRVIPFSSSKEGDKHCLTGVFADKESNHLFCTDKYRLMAVPVEVSGVGVSCILPGSKFLGWDGFAEDESVGAVLAKKDEKNGITPELNFKLVSGVWEYWVKTICDKIPEWRQNVPTQDGAHVVTISDGDASALKSMLKSITEKHKMSIEIACADGKVVVKGERTGSSFEMKDSVATEGVYSVGVNGNYLLAAVEAGFRRYTFGEDEGPMTSRTDDGAVHAVMPMRLEKPAVPEESAVPEEVAEEVPAPAEDESVETPEESSPENVETKNSPDSNCPEAITDEKAISGAEAQTGSVVSGWLKRKQCGKKTNDSQA